LKFGQAGRGEELNLAPFIFMEFRRACEGVCRGRFKLQLVRGDGGHGEADAAGVHGGDGRRGHCGSAEAEETGED